MAGSKLNSTGIKMCLISFYFAFLSAVSATAQVPLLLWSTDSLKPPPSSSAGHITSSSELAAYLTPVFSSGPHTVLLFLQEKLSKDDFTLHGGVFGNKQESAFKNLEAALQASNSVTFPAVEWSGPSAVTALLEEKLHVSPLLVDPDVLSELSIDTSANNLLLFSLPYCSDSVKSCKQVLQENDETIGKVLSFVNSSALRYVSIYTAEQPSRVIAEALLPLEQTGRSLLQAPVPSLSPPVMFNVSGSPCIMLWAQNLNVSVSAITEWIDLGAQTPTLDGSTCNGSNSLLVLNYNSTYRLSFAMSQRFYPVSARNWFSLDSVELQYQGESVSFLGGRSIYAPAEYSFHCQSVSSFRDALLLSNSSTKPTSDWRLNFVDFQIQGFGLNNGTNFSYASDCAGFFTPALWMGVLTSLLMLLILLYGLHMITQLHTMDRFDDPKGPFISVPQSE